MHAEHHLGGEAAPADIFEVRVPGHLLDAVGDGWRACTEARSMGEVVAACVAVGVGRGEGSGEGLRAEALGRGLEGGGIGARA